MPEQRGTEPFTIALHPIHDASHHHVADRLVYTRRSDAEDEVEDLMSATARALASAVYELGDAGLLGDRTLFVDLPLEWLDRPELLPTPAPRLALGVAEARTLDNELLGRLDDIRERGYRVIVPSRLFKQDPEVLLGHCDIIQLTSPNELDEKTLEKLPARNIKLLVENLDSRAALERYQMMGCDYYDGDYLARPSFIASPSRGTTPLT